jgi:hypothetical protein
MSRRSNGENPHFTRPTRHPSSRTGENPPYGMIGGIEETWASVTGDPRYIHLGDGTGVDRHARQKKTGKKFPRLARARANNRHLPVGQPSNSFLERFAKNRGNADTTARLPTPVQTEAAPMPAHQRLRLEDNRGFEQGGEKPIEPDEDQAICSAQPEPRRRGPLQGNKLLAEKCHLGFASRTRSE